MRHATTPTPSTITHAALTQAVLEAHQAARDTHRTTAPVPLRTVQFGQPFLIDGTPGVLFARVRDEAPAQDVIPVVAIAANPGMQELGRVRGLAPTTTVRLANVVRPALVALA